MTDRPAVSRGTPDRPDGWSDTRLEAAADKLETWSLSRNAATWILTVSFFATIALLLLLLAPLIAGQMIGFIDHLPDYVESARNWIRPFICAIMSRHSSTIDR